MELPPRNEPTGEELMTKWADYVISAVRYDSTHTHIDRVRAHADRGDAIGINVDNSRAYVVSAIKKGKTFATILKGSDGGWKIGQPVFVITVNGVEYIKTVENDEASDNLESLPEF
jgi:hypothetical protein